MTEAPVALRDRRRLSATQRSLLASQQRDPLAPMQNMASVAHLDGAIDHDRLADAFAAVVAASDVLRTRIRTDANGSAAISLDDRPAITERIDLPREAVDRWASERLAEPLALDDRAYDSVVLAHEDGSASWFVNLHHCVTDATASVAVFRATAAAYEGNEPGFADYYEWVRRTERGDPATDRASAHWRDRRPAPRVGHLYERNRRATTTATRRAVDPSVVSPVADRLDDDYGLFSEDLSWTGLLATVVASFLHRVAGANDFAIGVPIHNRSTPATRELLGPLVEVFPVDIHVDDDDTFRTLHKRVSRSLQSTLANARPGTAPAGTDIEAVVNVVPPGDVAEFAGVPATYRYLHPGAIDRGHLLRVQRFHHGADELVVDFNAAAVDGERAPIALGHFSRLLSAAVADPDTRLADVDLLDDDERDTLAAWGVGANRTDDPPSIVERLRTGLAGGTHVAMVDGDRLWSGDELWTEACTVAAALRARGVGRAQRVAIEMPRSADAVLAIYGTLLAGASYVPIDPEQPAARRERLVERAGCALTLRELPRTDGLEPLEPGAVSPDDECYLLFTSGSTGEPKGVPIRHRGLADYVDFATEHYPCRGEVVAPLFSALTFDLTVTSLFIATTTGGRLEVIRGDGPAAVAAIAENPSITWCKATPSHLELLTRLLPDRHGIETLVVGGEAFLSPLAARLGEQLPGVRIFNEYGPTEAVVGCMIHEHDPGAHQVSPEVPIGVPAPGVDLRIVDRGLRPTPRGAAGELLIASRGLTAGYLDPDPDAFVELDGRRWYRSGDLVRLLDDHTAVYLRRIDEQLKVGGIRLDPSEVEAALTAHPAVRRAAVRPWSAEHRTATMHCVRCGLADNVPGVVFDADRVCDRCHAYDAVKAQAEAWFRTPEDLLAIRDRARTERAGEIDAIALLSGGKDSTYVVYQLVAMGFSVHALTLDNGFISDDAKRNISTTIDHLGIPHAFMTTDAMPAIFRDSLDRFSNVCQGCFKTIYTLATNMAEQLGAPLVVTGLSRGQLFETRLTPTQFAEDRFDPRAIDDAVLAARKAYHRADDAVRRMLDTDVFDTDDVFERVTYVDFYRYIDVELAEMLRFLEDEAPWIRPTDTGRSTNCRINAAGIQTHLLEQGFHNYAEPYAWDVRLGHKQRDEALEELDDRDDADEVADMLAEVGYEPRRREVLTAWIETVGDDAPSPTELRTHLGRTLPAYAVPDAFVTVDELAMTSNGKLDVAALPAPERAHRPSSGVIVEPTNALERAVVSIWERQLGIEPISVDDDFFALGGDSLGAIEMTMLLLEELDADIADAVVFANATPRRLAAVLATLDASPANDAGPVAGQGGTPPSPSSGEQAMHFESRRHPADPRYNQGRTYVIGAAVDPDRFEQALRTVIARHDPLRWTWSRPRRELTLDESISFEVGARAQIDDAHAASRALHREPFDLENGPLVRARLTPLDDGSSAHVVIATHHISSDESSFDVMWAEIDDAYHSRPLGDLPISFADHAAWQEARDRSPARAFWAERTIEPTRLDLHRPSPPEPDGLRQRRTDLGASELRVAGSPPFATVLAALGLALHRITGESAVGVGALISTRDHPLAANLIGYGLNTVPLGISVDAQDSLETLRRRCGEELGAALAHRTHPFASIVAEAREAGRPDPTPQILVTMQEIDELSFGGAPVEQEICLSGSSVAEATVFVQSRDGRIELAIEHRGSELSAETADAILDQLADALADVARRPGLRVAEASPTTSPSVLVGPTAIAHDRTVLDRIDAHVAADPDRTAVRVGRERLSRADLDRWSDAIAAELVDSGVEPNDRVAMTLGRSSAAIAATLGIMKAAAATMPIDPEYPIERIRSVLETGGARVAVVSASDPIDVGSLRPVAVPSRPPAASPARPLRAVTADHAAYVIHTSGSTGRPRGVEVDHRRLAASTAARDPFYGDDPDDFLMVSSLAFDSSVAGVFWALTTGATLTLPAPTEAHDVDAIADLMADGVSHTLMVPSLYRAVLARGAEGPWPRHVIVAGEATPADLVEQHHEQRPGSELTNEYGPTEATVWATASTLRPDDEVTIGTPIAGTWAAVMNAAGGPCPPGVVGELLLGGALVTDGYDDGDDSRFAETSRLGPGRTFATGDRAALVGGRLVFHGRADDQLNIGGNRVEPAEIERVLESVDHVVHAVAVAADPRTLDERLRDTAPARVREAMDAAQRDDDPTAALRRLLADPARVALAAHVEHDGTPPEPAALRAAIADALPVPSRPGRIGIHDRLPRSPNGKIDRRAAAALDTPPVDRAPNAADGEDSAELQALVGLYRRALAERGRDASRFGPDDDFFDAGGDSLAALELLEHVEQRHDARLKMSLLFEARTPRQLLTSLDPSVETASTGGATVAIRPGTTGAIPLWLLPGAGGVPLVFEPFAAGMGEDRRLLAMEYPGTRGECDPFTTVEDLGDWAWRAIRAEQPQGPYAFLGYSLGGLVAVEVARRLTAAGETVRFLGAIEAGIAGVGDTLTRREIYRDLMQDGGPRAIAGRATTKVRGRLRRAPEKTSRRLRSAIEGMAVDRLGMRPSDRYLFIRMLDELRDAGLRYEPPTIDAEVDLFMGSDTTDIWRTTMRESWGRVAGDGLRVHLVDGSHTDNEMLVDPREARTIATAVRAELDDG